MIRSIESPDADAWAELRARLWPDADARELAAEARAFVAGRAVAGITAAFIAQDDASTLLGFIELAMRPFSDGCDSMPVPHIEGWYVEPVARGQGLGRALIRSVEQWARARGFFEIASDTQIANEASARAHEKCGFDEVERLVKFRKLLT